MDLYIFSVKYKYIKNFDGDICIGVLLSYFYLYMR